MLEESTNRSPERDLIFVDQRWTPVVPWYVVHDSFHYDSVVMYPPHHPGRSVYLKRGTQKYSVSDIRGVGNNHFTVPEGLIKIVDGWVNTWWKHDRPDENSFAAQTWARRLCLYQKRFFYDSARHCYYQNSQLNPLEHVDISYPVWLIRLYYDKFTPKEWHFTPLLKQETT